MFNCKNNTETMESTNCHDFLIDKLWENYNSIDERRRKSFYYLYYSVIIFGILAIAPVTNGKINIFGLEIDYYIAIMFCPSVILVLYNSYVYLCAHSLIANVTYLNELKKKNYDDFKTLGFSFVKLSNCLKIRDVTENINFFRFPLIESKEWDNSINSLFKFLARLLVNPILLLTLIIPFIVYLYYTIWFYNLDTSKLDINLCNVLLLSYYVLGLSFILTPIYFYQRVNPFRIIQRSIYKEENKEFI